MTVISRAISYVECSARERLAHIVDPGSFHEWLPPSERLTSPPGPHAGMPGGPAVTLPTSAAGRFEEGRRVGHP